jgi:tetratricopeptide (TPR) repeat protein
MNKLLKINHIENRIFGLDLLRFIAIIMVLVGHSLMFIPQEYKKHVFKFMLDGVSIFFVLSGFLIGRILFQIILTKTLDFKEILSFWKKRWLRTVPAYAFILLLLGSATLLFVPENFPATWYEFLYFSQNLMRERPSFFAESWSLCIEEWFYLLTPIYFFFLVVKINKKLAVAYFNRGFSNLSVGFYKWAIEDFTKALSINNSMPEAYFERGNAFSGLGKYNAAISDFDKALSLKSDFSKAYVSRGLAKIKTGDKENGCSDFAKANELGDKSVQPIMKLHCTKPE